MKVPSSRSSLLPFCFLLTLSASVFTVVNAKVDFTGHVVLRVTPMTDEQLQFLRDLQESDDIDFWTFPGEVNQPTDIHVSPRSYLRALRALKEMNLTNLQVLIGDLGVAVRQEQVIIALRRIIFRLMNRQGQNFDFENYHPYERIVEYMNNLVSTNPMVTQKVGGVTKQGRDIVQLIISSSSNQTDSDNSSKKVLFFECGIHAREWISPATCLWMINQLASGYGSDPEITSLVDRYDWKFVPITNPDGYSYSWSHNRLWRKNRNPRSGGLFVNCVGVDPNRNFASGFGGWGSSGFPCAETYRGKAPFSERESSAIRDLIAADRGRVAAALAIHSYSQIWMSPYSYTRKRPADYDEMNRVMKVAVSALTATYGTWYTSGPSSSMLYLAGGVSDDYYYDVEKIIYSYTVELRDRGFHGFLLPPAYIVPTAEETWNGIKAMVNALPT